MNRNQTIVRTVDLGYDQLLMLHGEPGTRVRVLFGGVWLTEEGAVQDVFAAAGEEVALRTRKGALLEALRPARVQVIEPVRGLRARLRAGSQAVWAPVSGVLAPVLAPVLTPVLTRLTTVWSALRPANAVARRNLPQARPAKFAALAIAIGVGIAVPELIAKQFALEQAQSQATALAKAGGGAAGPCDVGADAKATLPAVASARTVFVPIN
ncbi:MAG TPA: DUF2917 domain-containing protein [Burkholderiaceae bacterium]|nr:DUF2917 domain-containing protein [Burkholderiaceae bacterium]